MPLILGQGLPDWQRDTLPLIPTGVLLSFANGAALVGTTTYGPFLVSGYQTLAISGFLVQTPARGLSLTVRFYADATLTTLISQTFYTIRNTAISSYVYDTLPVTGPYVRFTLDASAALTIGATNVLASPVRFFGADMNAGQEDRCINQQNIAAGAVFSAVKQRITPGRHYVNVVCGNAYGAAGVAAVPWTLEIDKLDQAGAAQPVAIITNDAAVPANRQGKDAEVMLPFETVRYSLKNDDAVARDFTVTTQTFLRP